MMNNIIAVYFTAYNQTHYNGFISGGERHFIEVFKRIREDGLYIITSPVGRMILEKEWIKVKKYFVVSIPWENKLANSYLGLLFLYSFRILFSIVRISTLSLRCSLVCSPSHFLHELIPTFLLYKKNPHAKFVVYLHHLEPSPFKRSKYHRFFPSILIWLSQFFALRIIKRNATLIFTCPSAKKELVKRNIAEDKIKIIYNGVNTELINKLPSSSEYYDGVFLGRLTPLKGIFDLIDIWAGVCQRYPYAKLAIIGHENKRFLQMLKKKIKDNNLYNNIELLGLVSEEEKYRVLKSSKIFIYPSYEEGWGISVCEAFMCGLPVMAYDLEAYKIFQEYIEVIPIGCKEIFIERICKFLEDEQNKNKRTKRIPEIIIQKFNWDNISRIELEQLKLM